MGWFKKKSKEPGWMAIAVGEGRVDLVHGAHAGTGSRPQVFQFGSRPLAAADDFARSARELDLGRYQCETLLKPGEYQLLLVDAPNVPRDELRTAIRWRVKDLLDYHVDDATLDVLDIPPPKNAPARGHSMYAVATPNETVHGYMRRFEDAHVPLAVIDIPETAQRNIAVLHESDERALALLYLGERDALLTISAGGELYMARRIDISAGDVRMASSRERFEAHERLLLEVQRSLDHFERQFGSIAVARVLLGPEPDESGLLAHFQGNLGVPVARVQLADVLELPGGAFAPDAEWRLFHLIGASLRHEAAVL